MVKKKKKFSLKLDITPKWVCHFQEAVQIYTT